MYVCMYVFITYRFSTGVWVWLGGRQCVQAIPLDHFSLIVRMWSLWAGSAMILIYKLTPWNREHVESWISAKRWNATLEHSSVKNFHTIFIFMNTIYMLFENVLLCFRRSSGCLMNSPCNCSFKFFFFFWYYMRHVSLLFRFGVEPYGVIISK